MGRVPPKPGRCSVHDSRSRVKRRRPDRAPCGHPAGYRLLDAVQVNAKHGLATPANWKPGEDVIIPTSVSDEDAKKKYPQGFKTHKPYLRTVSQPR